MQKKKKENGPAKTASYPDYVPNQAVCGLKWKQRVFLTMTVSMFLIGGSKATHLSYSSFMFVCMFVAMIRTQSEQPFFPFF